MIYLLILALLLRLVMFNQSLWLDEAIQALALMGRMGPLLTYALSDFQPPLYHLLGRVWVDLAGYSEIVLRLPSLLSGVGVVYFLAKIGYELGGSKLAYLVGILAATNPLLIYYSQEGRTYSLTTFLVTAAMYYLIKINQKQSNTHANLTYYIIYSCLYLWSSYLTWFLHISLILYAYFTKNRIMLKYLVLSSLTLFLWIPSLISSLRIGIQTLNVSPAWGNIVGGVSAKALALTWIKFNLGRISFDHPMSYLLVVSVVAMIHIVVLTTLRLQKLWQSFSWRLILIWLILIPLIALFSIFLPIYSYTRVLFILPAYLLVISLALLSSKPLWRYMLIIIQVTSLIYFWSNPKFHHEDWRAIVADYGRDTYYALPSVTQNAPLLYYGVDRSRIIEPKSQSIPIVKRIIYLRYVEDLFDVNQVGLAELQRAGYTIVEQKVYPGLAVSVYEYHN